MIESALWVSSFFAGLLAGPHCMAMCSGYVIALSQLPATVRRERSQEEVWQGKSKDGALSVPVSAYDTIPLLPASRLWMRQLIVQAGRIGSYTALGTLLGALGGWTFISLMSMQKGLATLAALFLLLLALRIIFGTSTNAIFLENLGMRLFGALLPRVQNAIKGGPTGRLILGLLWGMTPCGVVYGVLPLALLAGGAWQGGLVMLAFGIGTLPNLLLAGYVLQRLRRWIHRPWMRYALALLIVGFAVLSLQRLWWAEGSVHDHGYGTVPQQAQTQEEISHTATEQHSH